MAATRTGSPNRPWSLPQGLAWRLARVLLCVGLALVGVPLVHAQDAGRTALSQAMELRRGLDLANRAGSTREMHALLVRLAALERSPRAYNDLGLHLSDQGDFQRATSLLEQAVAEAPADQRGVYQANLALNLRRQFRDGEAESLLRGALQQLDAYRGPLGGWRQTNLARSRAVALLQLSRIAERRGRLAEALALARDAQAAAQAALARVPPGTSAADHAVVAADLAHALRRELYVHVQAQAWSDAEAALQRWLDVAREHALGPRVRAQAEAAAAALALSRRRFDRAERHAIAADAHYASLQMAQGHLSRVTVLEARLAALWAQGRLPQALQLVDELDGLTPADDEARAVRLMPLVRGLVMLDSGRANEAVVAFEALVRRSAMTAGTGSLAHAEALGLLGLALHARGHGPDHARAAELLTQALDVLASPVHAGVPDGSGLRPLIRRRLVDGWVDAQLDAGGVPPPEALALLDWVSDGAVQRAVSLAAVRMAVRDPAMRERVRHEQALRAELDALSASADDDLRIDAGAKTSPSPAAQRVQDLTRELTATVARIRQELPGYAALTQPERATPAQLGAALAPGEALLVLVQRPRHVLAWLLRANAAPRAVSAALPQAEAAALVARVRQSLEFPERGRLPPFDRATAGRLHRLLLQPFEADWPTVSHLTVIGGGPLAALPLAVLAPSDGRPDRDADWPVRRMAISHASSVSAWLAARRAPPVADARPTLLGWGDPSFGSAAPRRDTTAGVRAVTKLSSMPELPTLQADLVFPPLPETRDELLAVAQALGADPDTSLFLGDRATRESVLEASRSGRLATARIVALATHGLKAGEWPGLDQPALVMAMPAGRPVHEAAAHMLRLDDTLGLNLHADWVVLSACNTTGSDPEAGEALSGLARGMFYAGARSVLATHWAVETHSASLLVTSTFKAYASPARPGKAQALRQAMLEVMQRPGLSHPAYWAPYVLIGDGAR